MGILLEKNNKNGKIIDINNYSEILKFEILEYFSKNISNFIQQNEPQKALEYTENLLNSKFEVPLRIDDKSFHLNGNLNELIINEKAKFLNFFVYLKKELLNCKKFYFIVSFIKFSGIQLLISTLDELEKKGIQGEIITSVYLNITDGKALRKLLSYKNIKVKIYNNPNESFHTKAYLFEKEKYSTCIISSSNISQSALYSAEEWNVKLTDNDFFNIFSKSYTQFDKLWKSNEAIELTHDFIDKYEEYRNNAKQQKTFDYMEIQNKKGKFLPNSMQAEILLKLEKTREKGHNKGLVVAATGTGKTYLAAMDIKQFSKFSRFSRTSKFLKHTKHTKHKNHTKERIHTVNFLFLAHREELLENAINVCSKILNIDKSDFGRIYGGKREINYNMSFATVQTLRTLYTEFEHNFFDYIVIDEFHHASADSYRKIIEYFNPEFLLGLTATPERMDGKDILALCDHNLVGEIGLKKAMEKELIAPFHYFGINDETIDFESIPYNNGKYDEVILTEKLSNYNRVENIINKIKSIGFSGKKICSVAFCQNIEHAEYMKNNMAKYGYSTEILTSKTNKTKRSKILKKFENKEIEILCVVDILNEGIDIPNINLLLFLRPTMSSTIFIQQLGRGLRRNENKEFVTVIDFIGNHKKDYIITKVFSDEINGKDLLYSKKEKIINEVKNQYSNIPGASYIELDRICQERIINKIEKINFSSKNILKELYSDYKTEIGKNEDELLEISDFDSNIELFTEIVLKMGSFYNAQIIFENIQNKKIRDILHKNRLNELEIEILAYFEKKIRLSEPFIYLILKRLLKSKFEAQKSEYQNKNIKNYKFINISDVLDEYNSFTDKKFKFEKIYLINRIFNELIEDGILENTLYGYKISEKYGQIFYEHAEDAKKNNLSFINRLNDLIILGLNEFRKNDLEEFNENILITYKEYTRLELQILLDSKVPKGTWRAGYANTDTDICLFITYDKTHITQENLKYDNSLHADDIIQWISQPKTFHESSVGQMFIKHREKNIKVHIFARKYAFSGNNKTNPFIYLGNADYYKSYGDKPMTILWKLRKKIPQQLIYELYNFEF